MPLLYYRDPADGTFKPYIVPSVNEIEVGAVEPTDPHTELWFDPTTTDGEDFDTLFVHKSGDVMAGPLTAGPSPSGGPSTPVFDTGWRNLTATLVFGWGASNVWLRRTGHLCTMRVSGLNATSSTNTSFIIVPTGFIPYPGMVGLLGTAGSSGALVRQVLTYQTSYLQISTRTTADAAFSGMLTWFTDDAWPDPLPGTAG